MAADQTAGSILERLRSQNGGEDSKEGGAVPQPSLAERNVAPD